MPPLPRSVGQRIPGRVVRHGAERVGSRRDLVDQLVDKLTVNPAGHGLVFLNERPQPLETGKGIKFKLVSEPVSGSIPFS